MASRRTQLRFFFIREGKSLTHGGDSLATQREKQMDAGDLIRDPETGDIGILVEIDHAPERHNHVGELEPYRILNADGHSYWFSAEYIEKCCEIISKSS